jgi:septal ring factor EnvC (AmiA/AmiB activator)
MMRRGGILLSGLIAAAAPATAQTLHDQARALVVARAEADAAARRSQALDNAVASATDAAARARAEAAAMAGRVQAAEAEVTAAQARVAIIAQLQRDQRARLAAQQGSITRLLGALQIMARRPPALSLVQPGSIADALHVRAVLDTVMPVVRERTAALRAEVEDGRRLRRGAEQAIVALKANQAQLETRRAMLARLEIEQRRRSQVFATAALFASDKALALGENAKDIATLLDTLQQQAAVRSELIRLPGPLPRPLQPGDRPNPPLALAYAPPARPAYRLPALGRVVTGFGEVSDAGVRARGLTIATAPGAQVIAPAAGHIAYAGAFRGWGQIVIIDHDGGWSSLITGLGSVDVQVGDEVDQGGPIGRAPANRPRITVELRHNGEPMNLVQILVGR